MCTCAISARRSTDRSAVTRSRRSAAPAIGCVRRPRMRLPIRARLTLVSAAMMAVVLVGLAVFLVSRLEADLVATVDAGLRSRASVLVDRVGDGGGVSSSGLTEGDEAFAQVLTADGVIVASSRGVTEPMLIPA